MPTIIPITPGDPEQRINITLDGEPYVLRVRWNTTDDDGLGAWYLDAWEGDGVKPIAFSIKLVLGVRLGTTTGHPLFLAGMFLIDDSGTGDDPRLFDLGGRVVLVRMNVADAILSETTPL